MYYKRRYYNSNADRLQRISDYAKGMVLNFMVKHRKLFKIREFTFDSSKKDWCEKFLVLERKDYPYDPTKWIGGSDKTPKIKTVGSKKVSKPSLKLKEIHCCEVIDIDGFDQQVLKLMLRDGYKYRKHGVFSSRTKELQELLINVKNDLDIMKWGTLFTIDVKKTKCAEKCDLIDKIDVRYVKTLESYFILSYVVRPSQKFDESLNRIIQENNTWLERINYNTWREILKTKIFISHYNLHINSKSANVSGLIDDLKHQLHSQFVKKYGGLFSKDGGSEALPSIEYYETDSIDTICKHDNLSMYFDKHRKEWFKIKNSSVEFRFNDFRSQSFQSNIQVLSQVSKDDRSDQIDPFERQKLFQTLTFPCVFREVTNIQISKLNKLKRGVYDFTRKLITPNILKKLWIIGLNRSFFEHKKSLTYFTLMLIRYKREFSKEKMKLYMYEYPFDQVILPVTSKATNNADISFLDFVIGRLAGQFSRIKEKTDDVNEVFEHVEELVKFHSNYLLQIFALIVGMTALVLALIGLLN